MAKSTKAVQSYTLQSAMEAVARSLREFGYPDASATKMREIFDVWEKTPDAKLPHGVLGMFAKSQFDEVRERIVRLSR